LVLFQKTEEVCGGIDVAADTNEEAFFDHFFIGVGLGDDLIGQEIWPGWRCLDKPCP
jgi:hypothetical protein